MSSVSNAGAWLMCLLTSPVLCVTGVSSPVTWFVSSPRHQYLHGLNASPVSWFIALTRVASSRLRTSLLEAQMCCDHSFSTCNFDFPRIRRCLEAHWIKRNPHHGGTSFRHVFFRFFFCAENTGERERLHGTHVFR